MAAHFFGAQKNILHAAAPRLVICRSPYFNEINSFKNKNYIFKMKDMPNIIKKNYGIANIMVNNNNIKINNAIIKKKIKLRSKFIKK